MRKLNVDDLFLVSEIIDKTGFVMPNIKTDSGKEKDSAVYGSEILFMLFKNMHKAKDEIKKLVSDITEQDIKKMSLKEIKETLTKLFNDEGFLDFFN